MLADGALAVGVLEVAALAIGVPADGVLVSMAAGLLVPDAWTTPLPRVMTCGSDAG